MTRWFCRMGGKRKFSRKDLEGMKQTAALNAADRNPYGAYVSDCIKVGVQSRPSLPDSNPR